MIDKLKTHQSRISIITNNIDFQLQQFDKLLSLQDKKKALDELNALMLQFEQINKQAQDEFQISAQDIRGSYRKKIQSNFYSHKEYSEAVKERENIYRTLTIDTNVTELPKLSFDLGDSNEHCLDYSKIQTVTNNANLTLVISRDFILELEKDIKNKPMIEVNDPAYQSYLSYNKAKEEMKKKTQSKWCRYVCGGILVLGIIIGLLYYLLFKVVPSKDADIDIDI